ncbi:hypothetical protein AAHH59_10645, partial [Pediococcus acidilactici]|uniref:hypothetical protein n=1 Tax=Pediococcus acidilactici TaxID=1254 RepID=UPI00318F6832
ALTWNSVSPIEQHKPSSSPIQIEDSSKADKGEASHSSHNANLENSVADPVKTQNLDEKNLSKRASVYLAKQSKVVNEDILLQVDSNIYLTSLATKLDEPLVQTALSFDVMLGVQNHSPQYGILGEVSGGKVALDLNQTHTI